MAKPERLNNFFCKILLLKKEDIKLQEKFVKPKTDDFDANNF